MTAFEDVRPRSAESEFSAEVLELDADAETTRISEAIRNQVLRDLRRRGVVVGLSGGIDSSLTAALCVRALGPAKVLGLLMPERDSDPESLELGRALAASLGLDTVVEDIAPMLASLGCYERRDEQIRRLVPAFNSDWGCKVILTTAGEGGAYNISRLVVAAPDGRQETVRMPLDVYLGVIAAANMKQRTRKQLEYYHADRLNYAVAGTPNRLEYDLGFFVKNGDGAADLKPIAHLYKSQVYQLAEHLGVPEDIRRRPPTTDTWSLPQEQDEFYFRLPWRELDLCLYALDNSVPAPAVASATGLTEAQIEAAWDDIAAKRKVARYLRAAPMVVEAT